MRNVGVMSYVMMVACLSVSALAQDQFVGTWQARVSPASGKHCITVNVVVKDGKIGGTVVLVNAPDGSETEWAIINPELTGRTLKFETSPKKDEFTWELTLKEGGREGLLHGSFGHMIIDERVVKKP